MIVTINGERHEVAAGATVATMVQALNVARSGVAVALDGEVIARSQWAHALLREGSLVEIVAAVQGG